MKEWLLNAASQENPESTSLPITEAGFIGISNRSNKKPIIAALNGPSYGGGTEALLNCDLVVALRSATISLPEVRRGVTALAGALPRIGRSLSLQQANELALVADPVSSSRAEQWGIVNRIADTVEEVQEEALKLAKSITKGAPEAIFVSQRGIRKGYEDTSKSLKEATEELVKNENQILAASENYVEGEYISFTHGLLLTRLF